MTHYRRAKRDPFRGAQIAPAHPMTPVACECAHARLMHSDGVSTACLSYGCGCAAYREATT